MKIRHDRSATVLFAFLAALAFASCTPRPQPSREDEIWVYIDLRPDGGAEAEVWIRGKEPEVQDVSELVASGLFSVGSVRSVSTGEDADAHLHGVITAEGAFQPGPEVVFDFDLSELSLELEALGYDRGSLGLCWPADGPVLIAAEPMPDDFNELLDTCVYWDEFPAPLASTLTHEPRPARWLLRLPVTLLTGALPVVAVVTLKRSRRRPDGSRSAFRWSLATFVALIVVIDFPPVGDLGTSMALAGLAGESVASVLTVAWWVLFAAWALLLYLVGPLVLLIAAYERMRARKLARAPAEGPPPGPLD